MKKWSEILLVELMSSNISVKVIIKNSIEFTTEFVVKTPTKNFLYSFHAINERGTPNWEISFARIETEEVDLDAALKSLNFRVVHDMQGDMDIKAALKVFSGVKKSMEMWLKYADKVTLEKEDLKFYFTGKIEEFSRNKLYDKFAKVISKRLNFKVKKGQTSGENRWDFWREK